MSDLKELARIAREEAAALRDKIGHRVPDLLVQMSYALEARTLPGEDARESDERLREILAQEHEAIAPLKKATAGAIRLGQYGSMSDIPYRVAMSALRRASRRAAQVTFTDDMIANGAYELLAHAEFTAAGSIAEEKLRAIKAFRAAVDAALQQQETK